MTDINGEIDYKRVRALTSVVLAAAAGFILCGITAGLIPKPDRDVVLICVSALVLPITGGITADGIRGSKNGNGNGAATS